MIVFVACGLALAGWAVVLTLLGLTRPGFPAGAGGERMVMGITITLVALTVLAGVVGGAIEAAEEEGEPEAAIPAELA